MMKSNHANRGKGLEDLVKQANDYYQDEGIALISKVPNDWTVIRKYNYLTKKSEISNAFPKQTIIDFIGIYKGRGIAFDCKESSNSTSFSLSLIADHQHNYLSMFNQMGGFAFYIIYFTSHQRAFILMQNQLEEFIRTNTRKSIPFDYFKQYTREILTTNFVFDYLATLEDLT